MADVDPHATQRFKVYPRFFHGQLRTVGLTTQNRLRNRENHESDPVRSIEYALGSGAVSAVVSRLVSGVGAGGAALVAALNPGLLVAVALAVAVLGALPLLLIATLALGAVYSRDPVRRSAAEKILDRLLSALGPRER